MADDPAEPRDDDAATAGASADSTSTAGTRPPDHLDEHSARRSDADEPGDGGEKHYEPL